MKYAMIGTWKMAMDGIILAQPMLKQGAKIADAIQTAVCAVENNPDFVSVGYGGLPNKQCEVELDAAYMNGSSLRFGGIMGAKNIKNPIKVATELSKQRIGCLLAGEGAQSYAHKHGFEFKNMLTESSRERWEKAIAQQHDSDNLTSYRGHDTVCMIGLDCHADMGVGVSTSGLFLKQCGRIGDSPIIGSGFYCDSTVGGAAATGLGEDIMRGCLSYEIVRSIKDGLTPQEACEKTLFAHMDKLKSLDYTLDAIGVIAMDKYGNFGAASSLEMFAFVVTNELQVPTVYMAHNNSCNISIAEATQEELKVYYDV